MPALTSVTYAVISFNNAFLAATTGLAVLAVNRIATLSITLADEPSDLAVNFNPFTESTAIVAFSNNLEPFTDISNNLQLYQFQQGIYI